jgi:hypothetical protein
VDDRHIEKAIARFRETLTAITQAVVFDRSGTRVIDERFSGLLGCAMTRLKGQEVKLIGVAPAIVFLLS